MATSLFVVPPGFEPRTQGLIRDREIGVKSQIIFYYNLIKGFLLSDFFSVDPVVD